jgi:hypothetical protein
MKLIRLIQLCALTVLTVVLIAACGHHSHSETFTVTTTDESISQCPAGGGFMGCALGAPKHPTAPTGSEKAAPIPIGVKFPDVSNYQGCSIDWAHVKAPGAAVKIGEGDSIVDACAAHNVKGLEAAKKKVIDYWFVRPDGTLADGRAIVAELKHLGQTIAHVVIYTGGTWSGGPTGGDHIWVAAYTGGTVRPDIGLGPEDSWQFTDDGYTAGLGYTDLNVDDGLLADADHVLVLDEEVPGLSGYAPVLSKYVLAHDPVKPTKKAKERRLEAQIVSQRVLLRGGHCYGRNRHTAKCSAELKHGDQLHIALNKLTK